MISWALRKLVFWGLIGGASLLVVENRHMLAEAVGLSIGSSNQQSTVAAKSSADSGGRTMVYRADRSGHFQLDAHVNGNRINFLVDTGATLVVFNLNDAKKAGLRPKTLNYDIGVQTANGVARAALVNLREVRLGQLKIRNVKALVNSAPMGTSLLGNTFLKRLPGYEVRDDRLTIHW